MCGIVGVCFPAFGRTGKAWNDATREQRKTFISGMLKRAQSRGSAATGTILLRSEAGHKKITVMKAPISAANLVETEAYNRRIIENLGKQTITFIGHTRAATTGHAADNRNNHPHVCGKVIGVHNGGISNHKEIFEKHSAYVKANSECDSEVIFAMINRQLELRPQKGYMPYGTFDPAVKDLKGWMAIAFLNKEDPLRTYLFRGPRTPLKIFWWPEGNACIFASQTNYVENSFLEADLDGDLKPVNLKPGFLARISAYTLDTASSPERVFEAVEEVSSWNKDGTSDIDEETYARTQGN